MVGPGSTSDFDPILVRRILEAFDDACRLWPVQPPPDHVREVLAREITSLADQGEWDAERLRDFALAKLKELEKQA